MQFIYFIGLVVSVWYFVEGAGPITVIKRVLDISVESKPRKVFGQAVQKLVNCCLCSGFWIGLCYYRSIELAAITGAVSEIYSRVWNKYMT